MYVERDKKNKRQNEKEIESQKNKREKSERVCREVNS